MSEVLEIKPADLLIDEMNPRLAEPNAGQREARRALASSLQRKVQMMARSIVEHGLNPLENHGVTPSGDGRYIVLEGNRRLLALAALENPDLLVDALSPGVLKEIRKLSKKYHESPIEFVNCAVSTERTGFDHWLELKHTGENGGAGVVRWGADESARFKSRSGKTSPELQVLDFLTKRGDLSMDARKNVNSTTLRRLIASPAVRNRLGIELRNRKIFLRADETRVAKALLHVVQNLPAVTKVHTKEQRLKYAADLPSRIVVKATVESGKGAALSDAQQPGAGTTKKKTAVRTQRRREKLIPYDCVLNVTDPRVKEMEIELRKLNVDAYTNAVGILLRVFIELNLDCYIARVPLATGVDASLGKKLQDVAHDLVSKGKLTPQQAKPVNKAVAHDSFLAPSVRMMHEWVHNPHVFPVAGDLLAHWNNMQPFIAAIWR